MMSSSSVQHGSHFRRSSGLPEARRSRCSTHDNDFHLTAAAVRDAITPKTRLMIINSPSNPTGRVIDPAEFQRIVETAAERGVWIISDECYVQFVYPPGKPFSAAALAPELRERTLIAGSFSKTYAMTGWRIGYVLGPEAWVTEVTKISSQSTSNVNSITQRAALAALTESQDSVEKMLREYTRRRDWLIPALNQIPGIKCGMPEGAFLCFSRCTRSDERLRFQQFKTAG